MPQGLSSLPGTVSIGFSSVPRSSSCSKLGPMSQHSLLDPCRTCHLQSQLLILVSIFHIISRIHLEDIGSCVTLPGISDAYGTVVGRGVSKEESALSLFLHVYIWAVCGHRICVACAGLTPVPGGVESARGEPQTPRVGEGAGHVDTETLLHPHRFSHLELIAFLLLQRLWGDTEAQLQPQPLLPCPSPFPGPLTPPQQRQQQQQGHHVFSQGRAGPSPCVREGNAELWGGAEDAPTGSHG